MKQTHNGFAAVVSFRSKENKRLLEKQNSNKGHSNYIPGRGLTLPMLEILMILPPPTLFISGTTALTARNIDLTLTLNTRSNSSAVTSRVGLFLYVVPALLTTISGRPLRPDVSASLAHAAIATSQSASDVTSSFMCTVVPPLEFNVVDKSDTACSLISARSTCAPS